VKPEKPKRTISEMDVLKDIRGLLSTSPERKAREEAGVEAADLKAELARYEDELKKLRELVQRQQEELESLKLEKEELLRLTQRPAPASSDAGKLEAEIAALEARKAELSAALAEIEGLLELKLKELLKRIARVCQEAGEQGLALEFRRAATRLDDAESFAHFLRLLLGW
jgi:predicted  nucleic acid-binding Zn-ribbon protein